MCTPVSDYTPLSLIPRLSCMGTKEPGNEAGLYCVVMSNSLLLSVYTTCYSGYTAEFAAQLATTTYDSAFHSLKLSNSEKQVHTHSLNRSCWFVLPFFWLMLPSWLTMAATMAASMAASRHLQAMTPPPLKTAWVHKVS